MTDTKSERSVEGQTAFWKIVTRALTGWRDDRGAFLLAEGAGPVVLYMLRGGDMSLLWKFGKALSGSELHRCEHAEDEKKKPEHGDWTPF